MFWLSSEHPAKREPVHGGTNSKRLGAATVLWEMRGGEGAWRGGVGVEGRGGGGRSSCDGGKGAQCAKPSVQSLGLVSNEAIDLVRSPSKS